jgi:hypothetical protein
MIIDLTNMESMTEKIPVSLYKNLSDKLISVILDSKDKDAVSSDMTKKIIYLWRQDQLATPAGIETLVQAASGVDQTATVKILEDLGLQEIAVTVKNL